jgi:signal transduction histidine kinase/ligand-binding sensor domain-containing protein/CheY-like chemotaxis protein/AraC-like DNA-binding protein
MLWRLLLPAFSLAPLRLQAQAPPRSAPLAARRIIEAAAEPPRFRHLTIADGLSQNSVQAIAQDRRGFLWFGTKDGLNRYDGYDFLVFRNDPADSTSISGNSIRALLEDSRGRLWVGVQRGGLNRFDAARQTFRRYPEGPTRPIASIQEGPGGDIWIGTEGGGLYRLPSGETDEARPRFEHLAHDPADSESLSGDTVHAVLVDRRGVVWVGTEAGLNRLDPSAAAAPIFRHYGTRLGRGIYGLYDDAQDHLWVGSEAEISVVDTARRRIARFRPRPDGTGWSRADAFAGDPQGRVWIAAYPELMRFDPRTETLDELAHDPLDPESVSGPTSRVLFRDRSDVLWVGTNGYGIDVHDTKAERFHTFRGPADRPYRYSGFSVHTLFVDARGRVWVDADRLYRWDRRTGDLVSFEPNPDRPDAFPTTDVWAMLESPPGVLWFGTKTGLYCYERATGATRHYSYDPGSAAGLPEPELRDVYRARDGSLWIVTENYLARLVDPATGRFRSYRYTTRPIHGTWPIRTLYEGADGAFWLGSMQGLVRVDPATGLVRHYRHDPGDSTSLGDDIVRSIVPDPREPAKTLWIGTGGGGLNRFDIASGTFKRFTVRDGLPNNVVVGVLADDAGNLWLGTNRGLCRFDPRTGQVHNYDARDGLQSNEFNLNAYFKSASGELFFGGLYGFTWFRPEEVRDNPHIPPVAITAFRLGDRVETVRDTGTVLQRAISETERLRLSYRDDVLTFRFAALDYSAPGKNRYAYRLLGLSDQWIEAGSVRSATYTNLAPGSYSFQVRASNNDGVWNEAGASLALTIVPPWWRTRWAYALYGLLVLVTLYWIRRHEMNRLRLQSRLEVERVEGEHLRELDRARSRFFANVSHEFRTPLTLTLGPLDDLRAGAHGPLSPDVTEQVELARRNAGRVLELIDQLLEVARLEAGRTRLRAVRLDLGAVVRGVTRSFVPLAERKTLGLEVHTPAEPVEVYADPEHLEKILSNLLSNALKFTPAGGHVRVGVEAEAEHARVAVRDSGPGIPAADLPLVFDRFHRADSLATRNRPGTGIGLALAKELAELHGGALAVASEEGFGSTFTLTLRRGRSHLTTDQVIEDAGGLPWTPEAEPAGTRAGIAAGPLSDERPEPSEEGDAEDVTTVLVVEDNPEVRAYLRRHLGASYRVIEASDGAAGLELARQRLPDLVLSDVMMDGLDGHALCRALKHDRETDFIPVILLTARAAPEDRLAGLRERADDYLTKPFDVAEVLARVENLITSRKLLRERFGGPDFTLHPTAVAVEPADKQFLERVRAAIEQHMGDETFGVPRLAEAVSQSRGHLHRRLRELLDESPSELILRMRLERAAQLLKAGAGTVGTIAYAVGFKSVAHFSNRFRDRFGVRPSAYARPASGHIDRSSPS